MGTNSADFFARMITDLKPSIQDWKALDRVLTKDVAEIEAKARKGITVPPLNPPPVPPAGGVTGSVVGVPQSVRAPATAAAIRSVSLATNNPSLALGTTSAKQLEASALASGASAKEAAAARAVQAELEKKIVGALSTKYGAEVTHAQATETANAVTTQYLT